MNLPPIDKKFLLILAAALVILCAVTIGSKKPGPYMPLSRSYMPLAKEAELSFPPVPPVIQDSYGEAESLSIARDGAAVEAPVQDNAPDRKIIQTGTLNLIVEKAEDAVSQIEKATKQMGGFIESSNISKTTEDDKMAFVTVRLPASRFSDALAAFKKLAVEVENEYVNSIDSTQQLVDIEARLKNAQAEEAQYQAILQNAERVEDILSITRALSEVRQRIEQMQAELKYVSSQVDMATITLSLTAEGDTEVFGLKWRPLIVAKQAVKQLFESLIQFANGLIRLVILLPVLLLWLALFGLIAYGLWFVVNWLKNYLDNATQKPRSKR